MEDSLAGLLSSNASWDLVSFAGLAIGSLIAGISEPFRLGRHVRDNPSSHLIRSQRSDKGQRETTFVLYNTILARLETM
jgi:hypothetical protein